MSAVAEMTQPLTPVNRPPDREQRFHRLVSCETRGVGAALARAGLRALSWPYGLGVRCRNAFYTLGWKRVHHATVPVVSVGNLTLGGTGKTPAVEYAAHFFRERKRRVAILSRGYGAEHGCNDEALVLEENLPDVPHLQGPDRVELAHAAVGELESELLILDDGFQHRRLHRDLDIVLVDATNPWGHGHVFPRGLLREPKSSLRRAALVLLTRCDQVGPWRLQELRVEIAKIAPRVPLVESIHQPRRLMNGEHEAPLELLREHPIAAFCGIGNPAAFHEMIHRFALDCGRLAPRDAASRSEATTFPDHHAYTRADVDWLRSWARQLPEDALIITTQKDLVKLRLPDLAGRPLWALQIALQPTRGRESLDHMLEGILV
jgi:tetraacyldisaccharide 4'-kinase